MGARTEVLYTLAPPPLALFLSLSLRIPLAMIVYDFIEIISSARQPGRVKSTSWAEPCVLFAGRCGSVGRPPTADVYKWHTCRDNIYVRRANTRTMVCTVHT